MEDKIKGSMLVMCSDSKHSNCATVAEMIRTLDSGIKDVRRIRYNLRGTVYCIGVKADVPAYRLDSLKKEINSVYDKEFDIGISDVKSYKGWEILEDYIDDSETRKTIWKDIFGNENVPEWEPDAAYKYAGSLKKALPDLTREEIDEAIREAKEK